MLDYFGNLRKSKEEKRQEALNAYLDDALSPQQRLQFEKELATDAELQSHIEQLRILKQQMRQLPRRRVPRNFTLDPALYGRPKREPLIQAYPVLRTATVLTAFIFIFALAANLFFGGAANIRDGAAESVAVMSEPAADMAVEEMGAAESEEELAFELEAKPQMTAEAVVEEAESLPSEIAEEEAAAGMQEMPEAALAAPDLAGQAAEAVPLATLTADGIARELPANQEEAEESIEEEAPPPAELPAALATPTAQQLLPLEEVAEAPAEEAPEAAVADEDGRPGALLPVGGLSLAVLLLGVILIVLLILTFWARRHLNQ
ncbi:MAG: hypothetical protein R3293_18570 [Candidatus Promineifilaceae bacterium]|nr:hypothetical protein [Candidatus Promineifilaceae bacterium]